MKQNKLVIGFSILVIFVVGYMMYAQSGAGIMDAAKKEPGPWKFDTLARCLTEKGMQMYGSVTCSSCAKQRKLFGDSIRYIPEIECNPNYPHPQTDRCVAKKIEYTPTWIMENADQSEIKRMEPGFKQLQALAEFADCPYIEDEI